MPTQQEFSVKDALAHIIDDMAKAISERQGEGKQEQSLRARVATAMIEEFRPQDVTQVMLAGYCVMFHAVMTDSVRDTLRGEMDNMRHATRSNIVAMNKSFHMNLELLNRYQITAAPSQTDALATAMPQPADTIQPGPAESAKAGATASPAPTPAAPQSRIPVGAAQPRQPHAQNASQSTQHAQKSAPGESATPPPSASVSSPT
jgi:hypothetical protein